jgi:hypothetical protein
MIASSVGIAAAAFFTSEANPDLCWRVGMGSDEKKKQRERFLLDRFLEQQGVMPEAVQPLNPPDPDFLIDLDGRRLGIELTEVFIRSKEPNQHPQPAEGPLLQVVESISDLIVSKARQSYFKTDNPLVLSTIVFSSRMTLDRNKSDHIAELIADTIRDISSRNSSIEDWKPGLHDPLYESVAFIHICKVPESRFARWTVARPGIVATLTVKHLQDRIDAKAKKIHGYKKNKNIEEIWLLMVADRRRPSQKLLRPSDLPLESLSRPFARTFYYCYAADDLPVELCSG